MIWASLRAGRHLLADALPQVARPVSASESSIDSFWQTRQRVSRKRARARASWAGSGRRSAGSAAAPPGTMTAPNDGRPASQPHSAAANWARRRPPPRLGREPQAPVGERQGRRPAPSARAPGRSAGPRDSSRPRPARPAPSAGRPPLAQHHVEVVRGRVGRWRPRRWSGRRRDRTAAPGWPVQTGRPSPSVTRDHGRARRRSWGPSTRPTAVERQVVAADVQRCRRSAASRPPRPASRSRTAAPSTKTPRPRWARVMPQAPRGRPVSRRQLSPAGTRTRRACRSPSSARAPAISQAPRPTPADRQRLARADQRQGQQAGRQRRQRRRAQSRCDDA